MKRPECLEFAMESLGDPEKPEVRAYVELLEAEISRLRFGYERLRDATDSAMADGDLAREIAKQMLEAYRPSSGRLCHP